MRKGEQFFYLIRDQHCTSFHTIVYWKHLNIILSNNLIKQQVTEIFIKCLCVNFCCEMFLYYKLYIVLSFKSICCQHNHKPNTNTVSSSPVWVSRDKPFDFKGISFSLELWNSLLTSSKNRTISLYFHEQSVNFGSNLTKISNCNLQGYISFIFLHLSDKFAFYNIWRKQ
jgi:hypothetical protein